VKKFLLCFVSASALWSLLMLNGRPAQAQSPTLQDIWGWGGAWPRAYAPPMAYAPVPPAAWAPPPPVEPPPPYPIGWVFYRLAPCADPSCGTLRIVVGADGANVRADPGGPITGALANGVPLAPLQRAGDWILVAPLCPLALTYTWSITSGVPLSVCGL